MPKTDAHAELVAALQQRGFVINDDGTADRVDQRYTLVLALSDGVCHWSLYRGARRLWCKPANTSTPVILAAIDAALAQQEQRP